MSGSQISDFRLAIFEFGKLGGAHLWSPDELVPRAARKIFTFGDQRCAAPVPRKTNF